jgi:ectoine hydroxylase-related dioxygenase (phytanoyl-CoA dioxygenase family)
METKPQPRGPDLEALPELSDDYPLAPEQIASFQRDGHAVLWEIATDEEIAAYRPFIASTMARYNTETRPLEERDTHGKAFIAISNLWERNRAVRRFALARRFAKIAAELLGVTAVRLFYDQGIFKEPGGGHTPWHQDGAFLPAREPDDVITLWIPLVAVQASLEFVTGSQTLGRVAAFTDLADELSDKSEAFFDKFLADSNLVLKHYGRMAAGDATAHHGWTIHRAPGNSTTITREVMTMIYYPDGSRVTDPYGLKGAETDLSYLEWKVGELAAGPLNPVLYDSTTDAWHGTMDGQTAL